MKKIISVVGPTASGKTALSVGLAKRFDAEIVSIDSMQIYRGMDVGTAKVTPSERQGIIHHMIDCFDVTESCNVQKFITMARAAVDDILSREKSCVLAGGTGLYVNHLISDTRFVDIPTDPELREKLNSLQTSELLSMLEVKDPISFAKLHANDKKRIVRALEVVLLSGKDISYWDSMSHCESKPLDAVMIGLDFDDREHLYDRINKRVDLMIEGGLVEEVCSLMQKDGFLNSTASAGIGYKEIISYLKNEITFDEAVALIKQNTRHYAKRQLTWFRRDPKIHWIKIGSNDSTDSVLEQAIEIILRS